jgi:hypothetical protein
MGKKLAAGDLFAQVSGMNREWRENAPKFPAYDKGPQAGTSTPVTDRPK